MSTAPTSLDPAASTPVVASPAEPKTVTPPVQTRPKPSIWGSPAMASFTGMFASLLVHVALVVIGIAVIPPLRQAVTDLVTVQEQNVVPTAELATEQAGGIPNPGMNDEQTRAAAQAVDSAVSQSDSWAESKSETLNRALTDGGSDSVASVIGTGGAKTSTGSGMGAGAAGGGTLAKFGVPGGGSGIGPKGAVFGNGGNAYRIAFVCDDTGTMLGLKMTFLQRELLSTIRKLKPVQEFNILFFTDGEKVLALSPKELVPATPKAVKATETFFGGGITGVGATNPVPALEAAFKLKPQLIYFLSDGKFDDRVQYKDVVARIKELNAPIGAKINTILLVPEKGMVTGKQDTPEDIELAKQTMQEIAKLSGGTFVAVEANYLK